MRTIRERGEQAQCQLNELGLALLHEQEAVAAEQLLDDAHLRDRGFWKEVEHPELGHSFIYPGEAAIYNGSPWRISRRAPLIGEHNTEIFCDELGLSRGELSVLAESHVI